MSVPAVPAEWLEHHLAALGLARGHDVAVHASLVRIGRIEGGAETVWRTLAGLVGPDATVVVPTYTLHLGTKDVFDPRETPSRSVGAFSEYVRRLPEARRSRSPLHSHAAVGPLADEIAATAEDESFGPDSAFALMLRRGFRLLLLGCTYDEGATHIHHVEAEMQVPYREWINLPRRVRGSDGAVRAIGYRYFGRKRDLPGEQDLNPVGLRMAAEGLDRRAPAAGGESCYMALADLDACTRTMLAADPWSLAPRAPAA